jgi:hypothetical protein
MEKTLQDLVGELNRQIEALGEGRMSVDELAALTDVSRELYERLVTLRYVAMERLVKGDDAVLADSQDSDEEAPAFRLTEVLPGQTSLIDAIEEIQRVNVGHSDAVEEAEDEPAVVSEHKEDDIVEEAEAVSPEAEQASPAPSIAPPSAPKEEAKTPPSVEKSTKNTPVAGNTVAERLRRTPIEDLRKAIGLNQKFQFINELFGGDSTRYNLLIDEVNSADSVGRALELLTADNPRLQSPDEEDRVANALLQLVERRFL